MDFGFLLGLLVAAFGMAVLLVALMNPRPGSLPVHTLGVPRRNA